MNKLKPGTRVRVTFDGEVSGVPNPRYENLAVVRTNDGDLLGLTPSDTIAVLELPKRTFEHGAYYLSPSSGVVYQYSAAADNFGAHGVPRARLTASRDSLVKLIPEAQT